MVWPMHTHRHRAYKQFYVCVAQDNCCCKGLATLRSNFCRSSEKEKAHIWLAALSGNHLNTGHVVLAIGEVPFPGSTFSLFLYVFTLTLVPGRNRLPENPETV